MTDIQAHDETITITLTLKEAGVMIAILDRIGGCPKTTARGQTDEVSRKIRASLQEKGYIQSSFWRSFDFDAQDAQFDSTRNAIYFAEEAPDVDYVERMA